MAFKVFQDNMPFQQKSEGSNKKDRGPEAGVCLGFQGNCKKTSMAKGEGGVLQNVSFGINKVNGYVEVYQRIYAF